MLTTKLAAAGLAAAAVTALLVTASAAPSTAADSSAARSARSTGWVATHTQGLDLGTALGAAPSGRDLHLSLSLPLRHADALQRDAIARSTPGSATYGHFLSPRQVRAAYGPTSASVDAVTGYLRRQGFRDISVSANRLLIDAHATVAQAERAFDTSISRFRVGGREVIANTTAARVPASLAGQVTAVLGLSDLPMSADVTSSPNLSGFTPKAIAHVYGADRLPAARKTSIALVTMGDLKPIIANLRFAEKKEGFAKVPISIVYDGPKAGIVESNPGTGSVEWDLDTQISTFMANDVKRLYLYDVGTFTDTEVTRAFNLFVQQNKATALSASLGECDTLAYLDGSMITTDEVLAEGALQGQSSFASTGDNGSFCPEGASTGVPGGLPGTSWPASGYYTTAVGGTTLLADDQGKDASELAWVGGGGGNSYWEAAPPWTIQDSVVGQTWQYNNFGGRSIPDVAAVADGNTGPLIYSGAPKATASPVGGTSVSAPLVMGLWARLEGAHGNRLGLAPLRFYQLYNKVNPAQTVDGPLGPTYVPAANPAAVAGFTDVTVGGNGLFVATPGWDYTTGIGTLQLGALTKALG